MQTHAVSLQKIATVAQLRDFDEVIDVRSPAEFALDHVPGAINCPVLSDDERARVGTIYKHVSAFEAKRAGAALVARNIAQHLENAFRDRTQQWRPLLYCWRGGGRSSAMCEVLARVGWRAETLQGGYQAYRRHVVSDLEALPARYRFQVICGKTGSAKSQVLAALAAFGAQVLDLERLACHRGSVLGEIPGTAQPAQKMFESLLWDQLMQFDPSLPVLVEAESRKVGNLQVPAELIGAMRAAPCFILDAPQAVRVTLLMRDYSHFLQDTENLCLRLEALNAHYGNATIERWKQLAQHAKHTELVAELLHTHYDPAYERSAQRNFQRLSSAPVIPLQEANAAAVHSAAVSIQRQIR